MPRDNYTVEIDLKGDVKQLNSAMKSVGKNSDKLRDKFNKNSKRMEASSNKLSGAMRGLGVAIVAALSVRAIGSFIDKMDDIAKNARSVGIAAEEFQTLTGALEQMGITSTTAHKSLINIQKSIGEAGLGTKTYTDALDILGLSYEQLSAQEPDKQFLSIIEALRQIEDVNDRALAGNRLLGRAYKDLGTVIYEGADGIEKLRKEMLALGTVIDAEALKAAEDFNDAMDTLGRQSLAVLAKVLGPLIQDLAKFIQNMSKFVSENREFVTGFLKYGGIALGVLALSKAIRILVGSIRLLAVNSLSVYLYNSLGIKALIARVGAIMAPFGAALLAGPVGWITLGLVALGGLTIAFWTELKPVFDEMWKSLKKWFDGQSWSSLWDAYLDAVTTAFNTNNDPVTETADGWVKRLKLTGDAAEDFRVRWNNVQNGLKQDGTSRIVTDLKSINTELTKLGNNIAGPIQGLANMTTGWDPSMGGTAGGGTPTGINSPFQNVLASGSVSFDPSKSEFGGSLMEGMDSLGQSLADSFVEGLGSQSTAATTWVTGIQTQFAQGSMGHGAIVAASLSQTFGQLATYSRKAFNLNKGLQIASATIDTYKAFTSALANPPGPPFSYVFAAAALATGFAQVSAISSTQFNPPRAAGGPVMGNLPGLVGENGPELFVPNSDGMIIPNDKLGGTNITQNITIQAASLSDMLDQLNEIAVDRSGEGFVGTDTQEV